MFFCGSCGQPSVGDTNADGSEFRCLSCLLEKSQSVWNGLNAQTGEQKPFPTEQMSQALSQVAQQMAEEDPEHPVLCSCHGQYWPSRDVDIWGICPAGRR